MTPSREPHLRLTPKGEAVVRARNATPANPPTHGLFDIVALVTCKCGAAFDGNSSIDHALTLLDDHIKAST